MYLGFLIGFIPAWTQGHKGGNINIEPCLHGEAKPNWGKLVSPLSLSSRYIKNTRNLLADSTLIESTWGANSSLSFAKYLFNLICSKAYCWGHCVLCMAQSFLYLFTY